MDYIFLGVLSVLWGPSYNLIRLAVATIPPLTVVAARVLIASVLLLAVLRRRRLALPRSAAMWGKFLFQASANSIVPFSLIAWAERSVDSGLAAILNSTSPIFVLLITWVWTRHEPATGRKLAGVILGLAGIVVITGFDGLSGLGKTTAAQLVIVAATLCYAVAAVFGRNFAGHSPLLPAAGSMICASVLMVPLSLFLDKPWTLSPSRLSITALVCLGTFSTAGALVVYFRLLATLGSIGTASSSYLRAAVSVLIGIIFLGERLAPQSWAGLALVLVGVDAVATPGKRSSRHRTVEPADPRFLRRDPA